MPERHGTAKRSLKARAIQLLALREQSRVELRRKLLPHAVAEVDALRADMGPDGLTAVLSDTGSVPAAAAPSATDRVDALLDWLTANGYLSDERFIESRIQARSARFGNLRIRRELQEHRLALPVDALQRLQDSELTRARALYDRRFDRPPADAAERARRARFMSGRGFPSDVITRVFGKRQGDDTPD